MTSASAKKTVWITGASSGIGSALAKRYVDAGWNVAVSARRADRLAEIDGATAFPLDVADLEATRATAEAIIAKFGQIDTAILNAGIASDAQKAFSATAFQRVHAINVQGVANGVDAVLAPMVERGNGQVVLIGSLAGYFGFAMSVPYSSSKAAVISMAESLRSRHERDGVDIKVINPGFIKTEMTAPNKFKMPMLLELDDAADTMFRRIHKRGFEIVVPRRTGYLMKVLRALPYWAAFSIMKLGGGKKK